jgi:putative endonuclease
MSRSRQMLGQWGESRAADFFNARGYALLERNYRTPYGEIDLIVRKEPEPAGALPEIVFVEVKTRRTGTFGSPEVSVSARKQAHLLRAVQAYIQSHPDLDAAWRIDVIAILHRPDAEDEIVHFENAVSA